MNGLELDVKQAGFDQRRQLRLGLMDEPLESVETGGEFVHGGRNEEHIAWPSAADPILRATKFARVFLLPATALQEDERGVRE